MNVVTHYIKDFVDILNEMSPYLLLGLLIAGILYVAFPKDKITKYFGRRNIVSVINATLLGIPLPLCSCGVIPTGISFYKNGASKGASVSFLISTPQTGVDSILVTYSLLGLPFAVIRPIVAFFTGVAGGILTNVFDKQTTEPVNQKQDEHVEKKHRKNALTRMIRYAFIEFLQDISKWLVIGLLIAAAISIIVPDNFFTTYINNDFLGMLIILVVSIPLYVCATASVPIAAVLIMKGISPGAALVFLMAGPATNAATITVIGKVMGRRTLFTYLFSIITGALLSGILVDIFLPREWFMMPGIMEHTSSHSSHGILPLWLKSASSVILALLIINGYIRKFITKPKKNKNISDIDFRNMKTIIIIVKGMTCNHCKETVEKQISSIKGIKEVQVNLTASKVKITGEEINLDDIKKKVESIGFEYGGIIE